MWTAVAPSNSSMLSSPDLIRCVLLFYFNSCFAGHVFHQIFCPTPYLDVLNHRVCVPGKFWPTSDSLVVLLPLFFYPICFVFTPFIPGIVTSDPTAQSFSPPCSKKYKQHNTFLHSKTNKKTSEGKTKMYLPCSVTLEFPCQSSYKYP